VIASTCNLLPPCLIGYSRLFQPDARLPVEILTPLQEVASKYWDRCQDAMPWSHLYRSCIVTAKQAGLPANSQSQHKDRQLHRSLRVDIRCPFKSVMYYCHARTACFGSQVLPLLQTGISFRRLGFQRSDTPFSVISMSSRVTTSRQSQGQHLGWLPITLGTRMHPAILERSSCNAPSFSFIRYTVDHQQ